MGNEKALRPGGLSFVSAVCVAAAILLGTTFAAGALRQSEFYSKSRLISMIFAQDQVTITDMAGNKRNMDMMLKFVGALTSAYINFEMIPVGEVGTFATVFESVPAGVTVDRFEYHRKNLSIVGSSASYAEYEDFLTALREADYFDSVAGHYYLTTEETIRFELECASRSTYPEY